MTKTILAIATAAALVACGDAQKGAGKGPQLSSVQKDSLLQMKDSLLAEKTRQLSEQSQIIGDAATSARLIAEIDHDLSKVRGLKLDKPVKEGETEANASAQLEAVKGKIKTLIARLDASEGRVRRMRADAKAHADVDSTQVTQLREYATTLADLRTTVERQRVEIDSMVVVIADLQRSNADLTARNVAMAAHDDSVFVVMGTKKELIKRGVIKEEGGTPLLFGRHGKTTVVARDVKLDAFKAISLSKDVAIPLDNPSKSYRIISRQSVQYAQVADAKRQLVRGTLTITQPEQFWAPSKYLVLVEQ
jgi:hypothetical protein